MLSRLVNSRLGIISAFVVLFSYGCASQLTAIDKARVGTTTAVHVFHAAVDALDYADKEHVNAAVAKAQAGDIAGAQADLAAWQKKYDACYKGLQILWDAIQLTADAVEAADQGKASLNVANLLKAMSDLAKLFADAGIRLPSGIGLSVPTDRDGTKVLDNLRIKNTLRHALFIKGKFFGFRR